VDLNASTTGYAGMTLALMQTCEAVVSPKTCSKKARMSFHRDAKLGLERKTVPLLQRKTRR
jgi:hypothetical protein